GYSTIVAGVETTNSSTTTPPRTEYYYYDAANRRRAVVGADNIVALFDYDANGNLVKQLRIYNKLNTTTTPPATSNLAAILSATNAANFKDSTKDEETEYEYDSNNHLT